MYDPCEIFYRAQALADHKNMTCDTDNCWYCRKEFKMQQEVASLTAETEIDSHEKYLGAG